MLSQFRVVGQFGWGRKMDLTFMKQIIRLYSPRKQNFLANNREDIFLHPQEEEIMTIIVSIICKNGLVMAADSQAESFRGVKVKRLDYHKITIFPTGGDLSVVVSGAGTGTFISKATDMIKEKYETTKIPKPEDLSDISEDVMTLMQKRYVIEKMDKLGVTNGIRDHNRLHKIQPDLELPNFVLMVGCIAKSGEQPSIYTIGTDGVSERGEKFASVGSGSAYAEYLLTKMYREDITTEQGKQLAILIVEEVKRIDPGCGGPTQVVILDKDGIHRLTSEEIKKITENIQKMEVCTNRVWWAIINSEKSCEAIEKFISSV
jgi:20S proteasome alpha/beta subunit